MSSSELRPVGMKRVLVLDFDNCFILNDETRMGSEEGKEQAWYKVYAEHDPARFKQVFEEASKVIAGGKGDRKDIVRMVSYAFGVPRARIEDEVARRCDEFNRHVQAAVLEAGISVSARALLETLRDRGVPRYLNTATPTDAVLESLEALRARDLFTGVYGRPGTKIDNLRSVAKDEGVAPSALIFVDDSVSSYESAKEFGCRFIGVHTARVKAWHEGKQPFPVIRSFLELGHFFGL